MNIYLVRHGESAGNVDKSVYFRQSEWEVPLTDLGREQAIDAANQIEKLSDYYRGCIISSPYVRAKDTATIIREHLKSKYFATASDLGEDPRLRERQWGNLRDIVNRGEITEEHFNFFYRPTGGESFADVYDRVACFHNWLLRVYSNLDNIIIVAHGEFNKVYAMFLQRWSVAQFKSYKTPRNGEVYRFNGNRLSQETPIEKM